MKKSENKFSPRARPRPVAQIDENYENLLTQYLKKFNFNQAEILRDCSLGLKLGGVDPK